MSANERRAEEAVAQPPAGRPKQEEPELEAQEGKPRGAKPFVFRFLPANPKNSLEFEDMADK